MIGEHVPNPTAFEYYHRFREYVSVRDDHYAFFRPEFLEKRHWRAVVVSEELSPADAYRLARLCYKSGYSHAWALEINHFDSSFFFNIQLIEDKLRLLEDVFVTPSYLVVEHQENFMLVSDSDYYWSIAGRASYLKDLFGRPLEEIDQEFCTATKAYRTSKVGKEVRKAALQSIGKSVSAL